MRLSALEYSSPWRCESHSNYELRRLTDTVDRREHHANSLFTNSRSLAPGMNSLIAMRKVKTDRTDFNPNNDDFLLRQEDFCGAESDKQENKFRRVRF